MGCCEVVCCVELVDYKFVVDCVFLWVGLILYFVVLCLYVFGVVVVVVVIVDGFGFMVFVESVFLWVRYRWVVVRVVSICVFGFGL